MGILGVIVIGLGLAMDALAVSIVSGAAYRKLHIKYILRIALFFGGFQALMPAIGSALGLAAKKYIEGYDHWVAFIILAIVGGKMIYESFKIKDAENKMDPANIVVLFILAIATSIDALAVGITISVLKVSILQAVTIIGLITFVLSYIGVYIGKKFGHFFENKIEAAGGIILIGLGIKILFEHLTA